MDEAKQQRRKKVELKQCLRFGVDQELGVGTSPNNLLGRRPCQTRAERTAALCNGIEDLQFSTPETERDQTQERTGREIDKRKN